MPTRIGIGLDYPAFRAARLPRTRRAWAIRRGGCRRTAARLRCRDHGEGIRPRRQPGRRHVRRVGNADGEISPVPRRALRAVGGAAGGTEFLATREFLTAKDGGLFNTYGNGGKPELATADLGRRWELEQIALRLVAVGFACMQGLTRRCSISSSSTRSIPSSVKQMRVTMGQTAFDYHGKLPKYKGKFDALISGSLHRGRDPARPRAHARAIRAGALRRPASFAASPKSKSR